MRCLSGDVGERKSDELGTGQPGLSIRLLLPFSQLRGSRNALGGQPFGDRGTF